MPVFRNMRVRSAYLSYIISHSLPFYSCVASCRLLWYNMLGKIRALRGSALGRGVFRKIALSRATKLWRGFFLLVTWLTALTALRYHPQHMDVIYQ